MSDPLPRRQRWPVPHDLSPWGMFVAADRVVQTVMVGLALASLVTWTVWLAKTVQLATARRRAEAVLGVMAGAGSWPRPRGGSSACAGPPWPGACGRGGARPRPTFPAAASRSGWHRAWSAVEAAAARQLQDGMGLLATIGSTAPFVGLFGTVWGIMNAFVGIAEAQTTNLAVVAPGIAEALLATALGLVAAIPAVVFYNGFARAHRAATVPACATPVPRSSAWSAATWTARACSACARRPRGHGGAARRGATSSRSCTRST